uniref:ARAD1C25146p n=1 Tax=Blastobotrys adeninivorans TaxID=409370 RepID=A0A060T719_BLAAD
MKLAPLVVLVSVLAIVSAWSAEDREIFSLRDAVSKDLGPDMTFYDWLKVSSSATDAEIAKAYRRLSQKLHPDKNPSKSAQEKFTRLGLVVKILRGPGRDRYDFFLKHGFPRWKGTDYYYSRFRPGIGMVTAFLFLLVSFAQYWFLRLSAMQHRRHMSSIIDEAKGIAWPNGIPTSKRQVTLPNGKNFMVYTEGTVSLVEDKHEYPLDIEEIVLPTWKNTILYTIPKKLYYKVSGKVDPAGGQAVDTSADNEPSKDKKKPKPKPVTKVGGRRKRA